MWRGEKKCLSEGLRDQNGCKVMKEPKAWQKNDRRRMNGWILLMQSVWHPDQTKHWEKLRLTTKSIQPNEVTKKSLAHLFIHSFKQLTEYAWEYCVNRTCMKLSNIWEKESFAMENVIQWIARINKQDMLEFKETLKCWKCGYILMVDKPACYWMKTQFHTFQVLLGTKVSGTQILGKRSSDIVWRH